MPSRMDCSFESKATRKPLSIAKKQVQQKQSMALTGTSNISSAEEEKQFNITPKKFPKIEFWGNFYNGEWP